MISALLIGFETLASFVGFNSLSYEMTQADYQMIAHEIGTQTYYDTESDYLTNIHSARDICSIEGIDRYYLVELSEPGFLIFDKKNHEIVQYHIGTFSPYFLYERYVALFDSSNTYSYFVLNNENCCQLDLEGSIIGSFSFSDYYFRNGSLEDEFTSININQNSVLINDFLYFRRLYDNHGVNDDGTCAIISVEILLGYYDSFVDDRIVDEIFDNNSNDFAYTFDLYNFNESPGTKNEINGFNFKDYLIDFAVDNTTYSANNGMTTDEQVELIEDYLIEKNCLFTTTSVEENFFTGFNRETETLIKNAINANRPIIANGREHSMVVFGYDNDYAYVVTGYGYEAAVPWSVFRTSLSNWVVAAIDIQLQCSHYHCNNYHSYITKKDYCSCGYYFDLQEIIPGDFGFEAQYFFYVKNKNFTIDGNEYSTSRLRTGFIEQEFINLSPRRANAGWAYLDITAQRFIRNIQLDISFWSSNELFGNGHAFIEYLDPIDSTWTRIFDLTRDIQLSTNRYNQNKINIYFPNGIKSFRLIAITEAIGERNKGRISIGRFELIHYDA